jgi:multiple sugar transport system permease protein/sn-glycerol 3-phosphate transport system permease protein
MATSTALSTTEAQRRRARRLTGEVLASWLFLLPAGLLLLAFVFYPLFYLLYVSLLHWNLIGRARFVGLANYSSLLQSVYFWQAVWNTVWMTAGTLVITLPLAFFTAQFVHLELNRRLSGLYRSAAFAPYVFPLVASGVVWNLMLQKQGIANWALSLLHLAGPHWLSQGVWPLVSIILVTTWQFFGYYTVIFLSGLQGVPPTLYEAAAIDGASAWTRLTRITLPMISPTLFFATVILVLQGFQTFTQAYVMTSGGPNGATTTLVYYLYQEAFQFFNIGRAGAVSVMLLILLVAITLVQFWLSRRWVNYDQL